MHLTASPAQCLQVLHATVASLRIQHASRRCGHGMVSH
jgi:hypothetical protein